MVNRSAASMVFGEARRMGMVGEGAKGGGVGEGVTAAAAAAVVADLAVVVADLAVVALRAEANHKARRGRDGVAVAVALLG